MRNIHKAIIAVFCGGVFLSGIGTGIACYEFSSFAYTGETFIGNVEMTTKNLDYTFQLQEGSTLRLYRNYYLYQALKKFPKLISDETIPENTVRFEITYNEKAVEPYLSFSEEDSEDPYVGVEVSYLQDDLEIFMSGKDKLLEDLKNSRIGSYRTVTIESIRIFVNPATEALVTIDY